MAVPTTASSDPFRNQHAMYDQQYATISAMVGSEDDEAPDWPALALRLDEALSDPALPRWHRAEYHIIHAWCTQEPELQLERARESIEGMVQVLQAEGLSQEQIDARLEPLTSMMATTQSALDDKNKEKAAREEKDKAELAEK
ncbi:uncharacterized protein RCC_02244 [Ramularia collo-cygni]|uniref:Uncharacterized protein n=1 Tax=Ramularia collo-cygni TaxID=112498 RepID=A0A2D3UNH0_9PEZI|nr:uncharacterized protein RCC_02244 [Ramularia collo-cygni]CZT16401.1 uncharacterized protein RCC_02244 [Ramularia collo-cygni]